MTALSRRGFLIGAGSLIAAPAIVRIQNIMPVKRLPLDIAAIRDLLAANIISPIEGRYFVGIMHSQFYRAFFEDGLVLETVPAEAVFREGRDRLVIRDAEPNEIPKFDINRIGKPHRAGLTAIPHKRTRLP